MYLWTSEFVSRGHPDKVADQIADAVLDAHLAVDPAARVACEVLLMKDLIVIGGEIGSEAEIEIETVVRECVCRLGYDAPERCFDGSAVRILNQLKVQSPEIAKAVCQQGGEIGAGDQGVMFGYAVDETPNRMPITHELSREIIQRMEADIDAGREGGGWGSPFLPDAKSQVTLCFDEARQPVAIDTIVVSTLHAAGTSLDEIRAEVEARILGPMRADHANLFRDDTRLVINPAGAWHVGGPAADTGLTGRKTVIDSYGADCPIGGGSFSGKDPTKVDRSAAYAARHAAKNLVAAGLAGRATVQIAYAIGIAEPVSLRVFAHGTSTSHDDLGLTELIKDRVDFTPKAIIDRFDLRRPIYARTAAGGHFGRADFPWDAVGLGL